MLKRFKDRLNDKTLYAAAWTTALMAAAPVNSDAMSFTEVLTKTRDLIGSTALILGPGLGLAFGLQGVMKIRRKDDDPKEFSRGITLIGVGVACAVIGVLIKSILEAYGQSSAGIDAIPQQ